MNEWKAWDVTEWNHRLLDAVLGARSQSGGPTRIIDVTEPFLASVAGETADRGEEIREAFLALYRIGPTRARDLFDAEKQLSQGSVAADRSPSFFGQLYLSCIVASATSGTYQEGNFRRRLARILGLAADSDYLSRGGLASLWEALAKWSERASSAGRPFRPLVLPDPGGETIIGYSKRLAFPAYADQTRLAAIIANDDLSTDSPVQHILRAIGSRTNHFSSAFFREFSRFRAAVSRPGCEATATLFWAAFESVSWAPPEQTTSRTSRLRLALTVRIPSPVIECLTGGLRPGPSERGWRVEKIDQMIEGCDGRLVGPDGEAPMEYLLAGGDFYGEIALGNLKKLIRQGCVPFGSSETHPWVSRRSVPKAGVIRLLLRQDVAEAARKRLDALPLADPPRWIAMDRPSDWLLVGPLVANDSVRELGQTEPFNKLDAFKLAFTGVRLELVNAITLPDGILFLPPRLPAITCADADELVVDAGDGSESRRFALVADGDGVWKFRATRRKQ